MLLHGYRAASFLTAVAIATKPSSPHGLFIDSCPNQHCQTSSGWSLVHVDNTTMVRFMQLSVTPSGHSRRI